jgi:putative transposase
MARHQRWFFEGISQHVRLRGNNGCDTFRDHEDDLVFLALLRHNSERFDVSIHGFALMTNHVHILATPATENSLPLMIQDIGRRYVPYFNRRYGRTGTLWEGRYQASPIFTERYWLTCLRYIDMNPVRARMVETPDAYRWTSYGAHALGADDDMVSAHYLYRELGASPAERQAAYRALCDQALTDVELTTIRFALDSDRPTGAETIELSFVTAT